MKRFIEESFPVKEVSAESAREKSISHITALHNWWARRPLASSRATAYAALTPPSQDMEEWNQKRNFISELSKWDNSLNSHFIEKAREEILEANGGVPPKVLDPFGGGGAIPLEALRLGCETYSNDLNPVAVLIQKCTLEYPQKYGRPREVITEYTLSGAGTKNPLLEDLKKWCGWMFAETKAELNKFYPEDEDGSIPVGYIWVKTIPCQNPSCGITVPLTINWWLAKKTQKKVAIFPYVENKRITFKIAGHDYEPMPEGFDPTKGSVSRAVAVCPACGGTVEAALTRKLFQNGHDGEQMVAVVTHRPGMKDKRYRVATEDDLAVFLAAEKYLVEKREKLTIAWGIDAVPDEPLPPERTLGFGVQRYGMLKWGDLFNARQKLALITFIEKAKIVHQSMLGRNIETEYVTAVVSYLALLIDRMAGFTSRLCPYNIGTETVAQVFSRQAVAMVWDYAEKNPISDAAGSMKSLFKSIQRSISHISQTSSIPATITQSSATALPYPDNTFGAAFTDPPYYDNVPYSHLSDFFYVWLKRTLGDLYPDLFSTPLTPKKNEIVAYSHGPGGFEEGKRFFEKSLKQSFQEIHRVLKPNGIAVIVYAHKSTDGWETLINSLLDSGLIMTGAWPLNTEMKSRLRAQESAALASSIYIVARKMERQPTGFYNEVKEEMRAHLNAKLHRLWEEGLSGADFFIAAIGSAIEVFGKYEQVMDYEGNIVRADRLLDDVREIATDYAVKQILRNGFAGEISDQTRFYVLWRWEFGEARVNFDEARKLAQCCGVDIAREWNRKGFVVKEKQFIRVLGPQSRRMDDLRDTRELIDTLHHVLLLWETSQREEMIHTLAESGYGESEVFFRVAQAISETLPIESREKKLLDGFLAGRERIREKINEETREGARQGLLF